MACIFVESPLFPREESDIFRRSDQYSVTILRPKKSYEITIKELLMVLYLANMKCMLGGIFLVGGKRDCVLWKHLDENNQGFIPFLHATPALGNKSHFSVCELINGS